MFIKIQSFFGLLHNELGKIVNDAMRDIDSIDNMADYILDFSTILTLIIFSYR